MRLLVEPPLLAALAGRLTEENLARMHEQLDRLEHVAIYGDQVLRHARVGQ